ncbi:M23 family metallopeptidase [Lysinibacillus sphaericus]|uniref:Peptidase M23 n=3 Tax=Lysinibacillus TaxID=400634 RepID=A0A2S0JY48_LYSSH|nr:MULTISPECIES: M23 family metallopeptidase [Lysinibacillus]AVK96062.1 peptidase M23 [Lysinibacillus sphaericus]MCS1383749.1 M23 family metallopeptidase [Lysinibacillus sphaericus]MED4544663.1 M23 family metallopeptidase [Lysinibacillus sphaericus]TKI20785.1 M23 family metallopeptidase [Lysinibacillus sphaericus]TKI49952.1 M23 family metallopeptidase [Lysinibacillus tabacifolii]
MFKKWKWVVMILLVATIILVIRLEDQGVIATPVRKLVTTSADMTYLSELGKSLLKKEDETIMVSSDVGQTELLTFANAQVFKEGFLLQYEVGLPVYAGQSGLVVFTGHTKYTGKTMTISYEDGTTVTYGMLDSLAQLPYTTVQANDLIGMKQTGQLYISIEKEKTHYNLEQIVQWIESTETDES